MATKNISNWDEFIASASETIEENTTYILTTDIDIASTPLTKQITWSGGGSYRKTYTTAETGLKNAKKINGITYYGGGNVFNFASQSVTFENIHFINCQVTTGTLFTHSHTNDSPTPFIRFNRCIVTGFVNYLSFPKNPSSGGGTISPNICFYQCAFNVKGTQLTNSSGIARVTLFTECWIHFDKLGNTNYISYAGMFCQCYFEGSCTNNTYYNYYSIFYNCVINMDLSTTGSANYRYWGYSGYSWSYNMTPSTDLWYGNNYCIINSSKLAQTVSDSATTFTRLTDAQMKSVAQINTAAPNFPISD